MGRLEPPAEIMLLIHSIADSQPISLSSLGIGDDFTLSPTSSSIWHIDNANTKTGEYLVSKGDLIDVLSADTIVYIPPKETSMERSADAKCPRCTHDMWGHLVNRGCKVEGCACGLLPSDIVSILKREADVDIPGVTYNVVGEVKPSSNPVVFKEKDGQIIARYQCHVSPRGKVTCECPAGTYRHECKHIAMVSEKLAEYEKAHAPAAPSAAVPGVPPVGPKKRKDMTPEELEAERIPIKDALDIANEVLEAIKPALTKWSFAGSLRREKATVHDLDIVAIGNPAEALRLAKEELGAETVQSGESIVRFTYQGVMGDITFMPNEEEWGATILYRTGPKDLNLIMRARAKRKGWMLNEHGLFDRETKALIAAKTEEEIFKALDMKYLTPQERDKVVLQGYKK